MLALSIGPPGRQKDQGVHAERRGGSPRYTLFMGKANSCCTPVLTGSELNHLQIRSALPLLLTFLPDAISLPKYAHPVPTAHG